MCENLARRDLNDLDLLVNQNQQDNDAAKSLCPSKAFAMKLNLSCFVQTIDTPFNQRRANSVPRGNMRLAPGFREENGIPSDRLSGDSACIILRDEYASN